MTYSLFWWGFVVTNIRRRREVFRQVEVDESQRHLQVILWTERTNQPISTFQLNMVTYGIASAPNLSTRCLLQLSQESTDPVIARVIKNDLYVDDMSTGAQTKEELRHIYHDVKQVLNSATFPMRKYPSNCTDLFDMRVIPHEYVRFFRY